WEEKHLQSLKVHPNRSRCKEYHFKNYPKLAFDPKWESYEKFTHSALKVQDALAEGFTGKDVAEHYHSPSGVVVLDPLSMHEGFTPELKELRCPNCHECGCVTSKGFAKGSARCYGY